MYAAFPRSEYSSGSDFHRRFIFLRMVHSVDILGSLHPGQDGGGSPRCHDASISAHAVLLDPAGVSATIAVFGRLLLPSRYLILSASGFLSHEAQSLHLRYGLGIALSTLNSCRCLHEPKTRFPVGWLFPFRGGSFTRWKRRV